MCGRYACAVKNLGRWGALFKVWLEEIEEKYNIAPSSIVPVFTVDGWCKMRWGLVPSWAKEPKTKYSTFNARIESFTEKPAFRGAWRAGRRCLVPVSGYYEWKKTGTKSSPFYITSILDEPLVFAGLWERWQDDENELLSFTILTAESQGELKEVHHRMPVIVEPHQGDCWLNGSVDEAFHVLSYPAINHIRFFQVTDDVGNAHNQGEHLTRAVK